MVKIYNKKNKLIIGGFIIVFIGLILSNYFLYKKGVESAEKFDLELNGTIINKKEFSYGHDYGFILIDDIKSNNIKISKNYITQNNLFLIKNNKCVLVFPAISEIKLEDSIVIQKSRFWVFRKKALVRKGNLIVLPKKYCEDPLVFYRKTLPLGED